MKTKKTIKSLLFIVCFCIGVNVSFAQSNASTTKKNDVTVMKKAVNIGLFPTKWVCLSPSQYGLEDRPSGYHARILYHNIGSTYNGQSLDLTRQKIHAQIPQGSIAGTCSQRSVRHPPTGHRRVSSGECPRRPQKWHQHWPAPIWPEARAVVGSAGP